MALGSEKRGFWEDFSSLWPSFGLHFSHFGPYNQCFFLPGFGDGLWIGLWMQKWSCPDVLGGGTDGLPFLGPVGETSGNTSLTRLSDP